jgi:hypothetical protein
VQGLVYFLLADKFLYTNFQSGSQVAGNLVFAVVGKYA